MFRPREAFGKSLLLPRYLRREVEASRQLGREGFRKGRTQRRVKGLDLLDAGELIIHDGEHKAGIVDKGARACMRRGDDGRDLVRLVGRRERVDQEGPYLLDIGV